MPGSKSPTSRWIEVALTSSTQDLAFEHFTSKDSWLCVRADEQSAGRGRMDRSWNSATGKNLLLSVAFTPILPPARLPLLSLLAGLSLLKCVQKQVSAPFFLKWPNDLFVHNAQLKWAKVGGILLEHKKSLIAVGIGLNIDDAPLLDQKTECLRSLDSSLSVSASDLAREFVRDFQQQLCSFEATQGIFSPEQRGQLAKAFSPLCHVRGTHYPSHLQPSSGFKAEALLVDLDSGALRIKRLDTHEPFDVQSGEFKFDN